MTITIAVFLMTKEKIQDAVYTRRYIYNFHYHLIWVTKYRHQTFSTKKLVDEMKDILRMVAKDNEIVIEKMEVMPDYVHVLISFPPSKAPTSAIKALKGRSAFIFSRNSTITILGWSFMVSQLLYEYAWQYE
ncbi:hypothetical protein LMUP508_01977 [Limosilactobacillus mucosae]|uniref:Transposase IS200-like domain-containing protein n=1 Tax=Limosilactobacillus mucosae TaxID=97478 RepID=A0A508YY20_LIMMU|nr:hypothetical protein LMUP508_01977 [Limosilactobacillus mucosae]